MRHAAVFSSLQLVRGYARLVRSKVGTIAVRLLWLFLIALFAYSVIQIGGSIALKQKEIHTRDITIDQDSIPHSHPVLTLHTRHLHQDDELFSTFLHEQLHWCLDEHKQQTDAAMAELKMIYPTVPVGYPDGARDQESTYLHLITCYLEEQVDHKVMGPERTMAVMNFWAGDHYRWVYRTVLKGGNKIGLVISQQGSEP